MPDTLLSTLYVSPFILITSLEAGYYHRHKKTDALKVKAMPGLKSHSCA